MGGEVIIKELDNGWVVETNYFCHVINKKNVFTKWSDVIRFVSEAMGQSTNRR